MAATSARVGRLRDGADLLFVLSVMADLRAEGDSAYAVRKSKVFAQAVACEATIAVGK